jgi:hypothetical protein
MALISAIHDRSGGSTGIACGLTGLALIAWFGRSLKPRVEVALFCASHTGAMMIFIINLRTRWEVDEICSRRSGVYYGRSV